MRTIYFYLLLLVINKKLIQSINHCLTNLPNCECQSSEKIECKNFKNYADLNFTNMKKIQYIKLEPVDSIRFDKSLDLTGINIDLARFQFYLSNIDTIELTSNPFLNHIQQTGELLNYFFLNNSSLRFLYRNKPFDWFCDLVLNDFELKPIFSSFKTVYLGYLIDNDYSSQICPVVFKDARIESSIWLI